MQTTPVNRIFNEWKEWVLVIQPQSCPSLSNDFKDNLNSSYLPKKIWLYQITWTFDSFYSYYWLTLYCSKGRRLFSKLFVSTHMISLWYWSVFSGRKLLHSSSVINLIEMDSRESREINGFNDFGWYHFGLLMGSIVANVLNV